MTENDDRLGLDLPDDATVSSQFKYLVEYWSNRNKFIKAARDANAGLNKIEAPVSAQYKVRVIHSYVLSALMNEKTSRYTQRPTIQVVPDDELDDEGRSKSTRIERAINIGGYEIERRSDSDVWSRVVEDAHFLDEGVEMVLRRPAAFWTEVVTYDKAVEDGQSVEGSEYPMQEVAEGIPRAGKAREDYKKAQGVPIMKRYIPLEYFFPLYDGANLIMAFDVEEMSVASVRNQSMFAAQGKKALDQLPTGSRNGGISDKVNIVQMVNNVYHAYYLAGPVGHGTGVDKWPRVGPTTSMFTGQLTLLYSYEHGLGQSLYNCVGGRYGGWKTSNNRIEGVGKGLVELSQGTDTLLSQIFTNVGAKYWPNLMYKIDPEKRGYGVGGSQPEAPTIKEGESQAMYVGEDIEPVFEPKEDPMATWLYDKFQEQIGKLGGSSVLFGGRSPGVDTGYHQALQITSAEGLDEKVEQHISSGAIQEATLFLLHCKALNERVYMHYVEQNQTTGRKTGKYVYLDPDDLTPLPRLDAQVRKQRPIDYATAMDVAAKASDDRGGKGPLLSDDTIRAEILAVEGPDIELQKIEIESQKREIINNGILSAKIGDMINIKLAKNGVPQVSPEMLGKADPALIQAIKSGQAPAASMGGTDPGLLGDVAQQTGVGGAGQPPGPGVGSPELFNRTGEAIQNASLTGAPSV